MQPKEQSPKTTEPDLFESAIFGNERLEAEVDMKEEPSNKLTEQEKISLIAVAFHNSYRAWQRQSAQLNSNDKLLELNSNLASEIDNLARTNTPAQKLPRQSYDEALEEQFGMQGILLKQSPSIFGSSSVRYCILKKHKFIYKEDQYPISKNAGVLNFDLVSCQIEPVRESGSSKFRLLVSNCQKSFVFAAECEEFTDLWYRKLEQAIRHSLAYKRNFSSLAAYPKFWRKDSISSKEFCQKAETGDLLLFRGNSASSVAQRTFTREEYDHIAVILLNCRDQVLLFEANGGFGVGMTSWRQFISRKWYAGQELTVFRKLHIVRSKAFLDEVQRFIERNLGKSYQFSLKNYVFQRSSAADIDKANYCCSSLVAKLYKSLGLLDQKKASTRYLPSAFADSNDLPIICSRHGPARLEKEQDCDIVVSSVDYVGQEKFLRVQELVKKKSFWPKCASHPSDAPSGRRTYCCQFPVQWH